MESIMQYVVHLSDFFHLKGNYFEIHPCLSMDGLFFLLLSGFPLHVYIKICLFTY